MASNMAATFSLQWTANLHKFLPSVLHLGELLSFVLDDLYGGCQLGFVPFQGLVSRLQLGPACSKLLQVTLK